MNCTVLFGLVVRFVCSVFRGGCTVVTCSIYVCSMYVCTYLQYVLYGCLCVLYLIAEGCTVVTCSMYVRMYVVCMCVLAIHTVWVFMSTVFHC